jgi:hypothetical protein
MCMFPICKKRPCHLSHRIHRLAFLFILIQYIQWDSSQASQVLLKACFIHVSSQAWQRDRYSWPGPRLPALPANTPVTSLQPKVATPGRAGRELPSALAEDCGSQWGFGKKHGQWMTMIFSDIYDYTHTVILYYI